MADTPKVRTEGSGEARVLVLHGWALDSSVWAATQLETNLEEFTYAYYDFPGYGPDESLGRDSAEGIDGMARGALSAADALGWDSFAILGHSMGGGTALRVATMEPDRVSAVVALTPVSPFGTPFDEATYAGFQSAYADPAPTLGGLAPHLSPAQLQNIATRSQLLLNKEVWDAYLANWSSAAFGSELANFRGPVTLAYGDSDPFVTKDYLAETASALPNANLVAIQDAGHYPAIEQPVQTVRLWEDALSNREK